MKKILKAGIDKIISRIGSMEETVRIDYVLQRPLLFNRVR